MTEPNPKELDAIFSALTGPEAYDPGVHPSESLIAEMLTGELPQETAQQLTQHLDGCGDCQATRQSFEAALTAFDQNQSAAMKRTVTQAVNRYAQPKREAVLPAKRSEITDELKGFIRKLVDGLATAADDLLAAARLGPTPATGSVRAGYRSGKATTVMAKVTATHEQGDADTPEPEPIAMQVIRAAIQADGRCTIELYSQDPRLQETAKPPRATVTLLNEGGALKLPEAIVTPDGHCAVIAPLGTGIGKDIPRIPPASLRIELALAS